jgi:hypothetical protein
MLPHFAHEHTIVSMKCPEIDRPVASELGGDVEGVRSVFTHQRCAQVGQLSFGDGGPDELGCRRSRAGERQCHGREREKRCSKTHGDTSELRVVWSAAERLTVDG